MASFGNFCLLLALCLCGYALFAALLGAAQGRERMVRSAERSLFAASASIALSFFSLLYLLLSNDFAVSVVASSSSRDLPVLYKIAAVWGSHDGSMLLWVFVTAVLAAAAAYQNRGRHRRLMPYVLAILVVDLAFFVSLNLFLSNPFNQLYEILPGAAPQRFVPADGKGLNPLLQHWAMVIHPPILYFGFIGFVVPFAFTAAALITRAPGLAWLRTVRRWTLAVWLLLGIGIVLGGKWAYEVLGWGGYWGWDPVENSSLMPWLVGTAFLHSVIIQERKGMMKVWNVFLVLSAYLLGIFGTFITRSGIVASVHAFADSNLGKFLLGYMGAAIAACILLVLCRGSYLQSERRLDSVLSRESAFLLNNFAFVLFCFAVFWGTMLPVFSQWISGTKITVGPPFFNRVNVPLGLMLLLLTGLGPLFAWRMTSFESLRRALLWPFSAAAAAGITLWAAGVRDFYPAVCLILCAFVAATIFEEFVKAARIRARSQGEGYARAAVSLVARNKRRYGGYIVHLGVVLIFVGLSGNAYNREATGRLVTGQKIEIGGYTLKMAGFRQGRVDGYEYGQVVLEAYRRAEPLCTLVPEKRVYEAAEQQATTKVALYSTPKEDLYVVFAGTGEDGRCEVTAHLNPLVFWLWVGAAVMIFGTLVTLVP